MSVTIMKNVDTTGLTPEELGRVVEDVERDDSTFVGGTVLNPDLLTEEQNSFFKDLVEGNVEL